MLWGHKGEKSQLTTSGCNGDNSGREVENPSAPVLVFSLLISFLIFLSQRLLQQTSRFKSDNCSYYHPWPSSLPLWQMSLQFSAQCVNASPFQTLVAVKCAAENSISGANLRGKRVLAPFGKAQAASSSIQSPLNDKSHLSELWSHQPFRQSDTSKELLFFHSG